MSIKPTPRRSPRRQRGVSLVELVLFIVIVGVAMGALLNTMNLTTRYSSDPLVEKQALMLAESFMEEVQTARFTFCDPSDDNVDTATAATIGPTGCATKVEGVGREAGETRPFDNVNDYVTAYGVDTQAFADAGGILYDAANRPLDLTGYQVRLRIAQSGLLGPAGQQPLAAAVLRITITVTHAGIDPIVLDGYRVRYAPNSPP